MLSSSYNLICLLLKFWVINQDTSQHILRCMVSNHISNLYWKGIWKQCLSRCICFIKKNKQFYLSFIGNSLVKPQILRFYYNFYVFRNFFLWMFPTCKLNHLTHIALNDSTLIWIKTIGIYLANGNSILLIKWWKC